jgi:hypothetical protein
MFVVREITLKLKMHDLVGPIIFWYRKHRQEYMIFIKIF